MHVVAHGLPLRGSALDDAATLAAAGSREHEAATLANVDGLCRSLARRVITLWGPRLRHEHDDLLQEARLRAVAAIRSYDRSRGSAANFIAASSVRSLSRPAWAAALAGVHVPAHLRRPGAADDPAIARALARRTRIGSRRLDDDAGDGFDVADPRQSESALALEREERREEVAAALEALKPHEREVIVRRYGLEGHEPHTVREVAREIGRTGLTVRNIELRALKRLRRVSKRDSRVTSMVLEERTVRKGDAT